MGEVYRAHDDRLGRDVALKVLPEGAISDEDKRRRFALEARAVAALNHPNILTVFDVDADGPQPFIAAELVDGETLRDRLSRGPVPLPDALNLATQLADGLAHAHDARIVHRDLKPQNVMVKPDGHLKILDFGLGKILAPFGGTDASTLTTLSGPATTQGTILGTAGYMSPEQVTGKPVDGRSDQFAFGAVLYELLTGVRAFNRESTIETISSVLSSEPRPVTALAPAVPHVLVAVVERCLAKDPNDRYASTRDLARDLREIRDDVVGSKRRSSRFARPVVTARAGFVAAAVLLVAVLSGVGYIAWTRTPRADTAVQQIAVLPFTNIQRDAGNDAFADGIVELLTTNLTQLERTTSALRVVPAADVRRYGVVSAKEARQTFGASLVVSGSIQRNADTIRLTLNLIDGATQQQRRARVIDARADNPLALQDRAFDVLAAMLGADVDASTTAQTRSGGTLVPGAYDFYVQGRGYLQRYERLDNVESAIGLFRRALAADTAFAQAHASLGEALWRKYELTKDTALIAEARAACAAAMTINDGTPNVHVTLSMIARGTGEYETAVDEARKAIATDGTDSAGRRELARGYEALGQFEQAEAAYRDAIAQRPGDWSGYNAFGAYYFGRKDYALALAQFQRAAELTPDNATVRSNIGGALFLMGRYDEARRQYEQSVAIRPTALALSNLGTLNFRLGRFAEAAQAIERATTLTPNDYVLWGNLASALARAEKPAESKAAYQKAIEAAERERAVNPRRPQLVADLAGFHAALDHGVVARELASSALAAAGSDSSVLMSVAVAYNSLEDRSAAVDLILRALDAGYPAESVRQKYAISRLLEDPRLKRRLTTSQSSTR